MDRTTTDLLLYAKTFCLRAEEEARRDTRGDRMQAVMHMQDAVEFCLNAVLHEQGVSRNLHDDFRQLRKLIDDHCKDASPPTVLPYATQIDFLNTTRGKIKHHASVPSVEDVARCLADGRRFLERVFQEYLGVTFGTLSLASLVEQEAIRKELEEAGRQCERGAYVEALVCVAKALRQATPRKGLLGDTEYELLLIEFGTDMRQLRGVRSNLPIINPILVPDANDPRGVKVGRLSILACGELDTTRQAVEQTLQGAVEIILQWQEAGAVGYEIQRSMVPGTLQQIRVEEVP